LAKLNAKEHDKLFKWMLYEFTDDFFAYFFPHLRVRIVQSLDKEFYRALEKHQATTAADLLLMVEVDIEDRLWEILIVIEHKHRREDVCTQIQGYACHAFLLRRKPVWCIAFFTDDARTRQAPLPDRFPFAFHSEEGLIEIPFDIIRLKTHQSIDLIKHRSLLLKLLALRADDTGIAREQLIRDIYQTVHARENELTDRQKMMVELVVEAYAALPPRRVEMIKKEAGVTFIASNVEEHFIHIGERRGERRGKQEGKILGALQMVEDMLEEGAITREVYLRRTAELRADLAELQKKKKD
jgi:hypothetical protein